MSGPVLPYGSPEEAERFAAGLELTSFALFFAASTVLGLRGVWPYLTPAILTAGMSVAAIALMRTRARSMPAWLAAVLNFGFFFIWAASMW